MMGAVQNVTRARWDIYGCLYRCDRARRNDCGELIDYGRTRQICNGKR